MRNKIDFNKGFEMGKETFSFKAIENENKLKVTYSESTKPKKLLSEKLKEIKKMARELTKLVESCEEANMLEVQVLSLAEAKFKQRHRVKTYINQEKIYGMRVRYILGGNDKYFFEDIPGRVNNYGELELTECCKTEFLYTCKADFPLFLISGEEVFTFVVKDSEVCKTKTR